jgi:HSP20 family molecular chaperone IbpA
LRVQKKRNGLFKAPFQLLNGNKTKVKEEQKIKINAEFKDGLLQIEVPKPEQQKPKQVTIY